MAQHSFVQQTVLYKICCRCFMQPLALSGYLVIWYRIDLFVHEVPCWFENKSPRMHWSAVHKQLYSLQICQSVCSLSRRDVVPGKIQITFWCRCDVVYSTSRYKKYHCRSQKYCLAGQNNTDLIAKISVLARLLLAFEFELLRLGCYV